MPTLVHTLLVLTVINYCRSTTADGSWANLAAELKPYVDKLPSPPGKLATNGAVTAGTAITMVSTVHITVTLQQAKAIFRLSPGRVTEERLTRQLFW